jgi:hypothetical protein
LNASLVDAESRAAVAANEVGELEGAVPPAQRRFEASSRHAAPVKAASRAANRKLAQINRRLRANRLAAAAKVSRIEDERQEAADKHDEAVRAGLGFGLAMLIAAGIALAWDWFRVSAPVNWLTRVSLGQAIGVCVGGGLLMVILGAAIGSADGIFGVLGVALAVLGFVLANALVLARHSAEVQRGNSKPVLRRQRLPRHVTKGIAGVLGALCLIALGTAVFAGEDESSQASANLRREATDSGRSSPALMRAEGKAERLQRKASALLGDAHADQHALGTARRKLNHAEARLASAEEDVATFNRRLAAQAAREQREAEAEARRAEEQAEREFEEQEEEAAEECDPNYSGCLDPYASDYDCAGGSGDGPLYTGTVEVLGEDHYGLDEDGDGIGCEP